MQKKSKTIVKVIKGGTNVQTGYHSGGNGEEDYAYCGYNDNLFFSSDRKIPLQQVDGQLLKMDGKKPKGFGLEIELSCSTINNNNLLSLFIRNVIIRDTLDMDLVKFQRDGSLEGLSTTEMITQVMSKEYIRNHYPHFKNMWNTFRQFGIGTNDSCGQHVNISTEYFGKDRKTQDECCKKIYYIINKNYSLFTRLFHRSPNCTGYCGKMDLSIYNPKNENGWNRIIANGSHGNCLNYSHYDAGRIEIRLVGGHNDFLAWRETNECVFHLCDAVKSLSWKDCDNLVEIFKGCNKYVYSRLTQCNGYGVLSDSDYNEIAQYVDNDVDYSVANSR